MKESIYKSYDELPLFLNADTVAKTLGVSPSSGYEIMHEKDFPALKIGKIDCKKLEEMQCALDKQKHQLETQQQLIGDLSTKINSLINTTEHSSVR